MWKADGFTARVVVPQAYRSRRIVVGVEDVAGAYHAQKRGCYMATPIGHALAGYAVFSATPDMGRQDQRALLGLCLVMAIAPDFDFLPGLLIGQPALYHQGISHSLSVAATASFGLALLYSLKRGTMVVDWGRFFVAYASHLAIDLCGADTYPPYGIPVFWPLSSTSYLAPWEIFAGVHHAHGTAVSAGEWFATLLHPANFRAIGLEVLAVLPVILLVRYLSKSSRNCGNQYMR